MAELSNDEVKVLGRVAGLDIPEPELTHVAHSLNAIIEAMEEIGVPGMNGVEPLPIILSQRQGGTA